MGDALEGLGIDEHQAPLVAWIGGPGPADLAELRSEVDRQAQGLVRAVAGRSSPSGCPAPRSRCGRRWPGGPVELSARVDLAIGRPAGGRGLGGHRRSEVRGPPAGAPRRSPVLRADRGAAESGASLRGGHLLLPDRRTGRLAGDPRRCWSRRPGGVAAGTRLLAGAATDVRRPVTWCPSCTALPRAPADLGGPPPTGAAPGRRSFSPRAGRRDRPGSLVATAGLGSHRRPRPRRRRRRRPGSGRASCRASPTPCGPGDRTAGRGGAAPPPAGPLPTRIAGSRRRAIRLEAGVRPSVARTRGRAGVRRGPVPGPGSRRRSSGRRRRRRLASHRMAHVPLGAVARRTRLRRPVGGAGRGGHVGHAAVGHIRLARADRVDRRFGGPDDRWSSAGGRTRAPAGAGWRRASTRRRVRACPWCRWRRVDRVTAGATSSPTWPWWPRWPRRTCRWRHGWSGCGRSAAIRLAVEVDEEALAGAVDRVVDAVAVTADMPGPPVRRPTWPDRSGPGRTDGPSTAGPDGHRIATPIRTVRRGPWPPWCPACPPRSAGSRRPGGAGVGTL